MEKNYQHCLEMILHSIKRNKGMSLMRRSRRHNLGVTLIYYMNGSIRTDTKSVDGIDYKNLVSNTIQMEELLIINYLVVINESLYHVTNYKWNA